MLLVQLVVRYNHSKLLLAHLPLDVLCQGAFQSKTLSTVVTFEVLLPSVDQDVLSEAIDSRELLITVLTLVLLISSVYSSSVS